MLWFRCRLRAFAWLACVAIAGLAIGPSISRVLYAQATLAQHGAALSGAHHHDNHHPDDAAPDSSTHAPSHAHTLDHCGLCVVASCAIVVSTLAPSSTPAPSSERVVADATVAVPRLRCDWSPASSRGPPLRA